MVLFTYLHHHYIAETVLHFYLRKQISGSFVTESEGVLHIQKFYGCNLPADPPAKQHVQFSSDKTQFTLHRLAFSHG